ncbi:MAG: hypothetical protein ACK56I_07970, partial [bacterium]
PLILSQQGFEIAALRHLDPLSLLGRDEQPHGAVVANKIPVGDCLHIGRGYALHAIAEQEVQTPVSLRGPLRKFDRQRRRVGRPQFPRFQDLRLGPLHFLVAHRIVF